MEKINAAQLSWLLSTNTANKVSKKDAHKMIYVANQKAKGVEPLDCSIGKGYATSYDKIKNEPDECLISDLEKSTHIPIQAAIDDISNNYLKRPAAKRWILNYPDEVIEKSKKALPSSIKIPYPLHTMLKKEVMEEIVSVWKVRFAKYKYIEFKAF